MTVTRKIGAVMLLTLFVATASTAMATAETQAQVVWEKIASAEMLVGKEDAEEYDLRIEALAVNPTNSQHIAIGLTSGYRPDEAKGIVGLYQSFDNGKTWQRAPSPAFELLPRLMEVWFEDGRVNGFFFPHGVYSYDGEWRLIMIGLQFLGSPRSMAHPGWFKFDPRVDPAYPAVIYEPRPSEKPSDIPPVETDGLYLCWDKDKAKLLLPPEVKTPAYVPIAEVVRAKEATQLYTKIITGPARYGFGDIWRITIPDSILRNPSLLIHTTLTLRIGSKELVVEKADEKTVVALDAAPEIPPEASRTFLPIRPVVEALGGQIHWFAEDRRVEIQSGDRKIVLWIDRATALVDGIEVSIDAVESAVRPYVAPPGRTMLPLRFVAEALGAEVRWDDATRVITIIPQ